MKGSMSVSDLRDYISLLTRHGELQRVEEEVDWNLEMGAIIRRCYDIGAPAPLFERIKGYPKGYRVLGAPMGPSKHPAHSLYARVALGLGLEPHAPAKEIMEVYLQRKEKPLKPERVRNAPCKENVLLGDQIDLLKFPVPFIHGGDGGRYIGTWHTVITKDPDSSWVNSGMYRLMVHDRNTMGCLFPAQQHIGQIYQKYEAKNLPMPAAVAIKMPVVSKIQKCIKIPVGPYYNSRAPAPVPSVRKLSRSTFFRPTSSQAFFRSSVFTRKNRWSLSPKVVSRLYRPSSRPEEWGTRTMRPTPCCLASGMRGWPICCSSML